MDRISAVQQIDYRREKAMTDEQIFISNLKQLMNDYGLNRERLANKLGYSYPAICSIIAGNTDLSMKFVKKVAEEFGLTFQQLFTPNNGVSLMPEDKKIELINMLQNQLFEAKEIIKREQEEKLLYGDLNTYRDGTLYINGMKVDYEHIDIDVMNMKATVEVKLDEIEVRR